MSLTDADIDEFIDVVPIDHYDAMGTIAVALTGIRRDLTRIRECLERDR